MDNKNNIEQFDEFFKSKLEGASVKAPEGVWEAVSGSITSGASGAGASWIAVKAILVKTAITVAALSAVSYAVYNVLEKEKKEEQLDKKELLEETDSNLEEVRAEVVEKETLYLNEVITAKVDQSKQVEKDHSNADKSASEALSTDPLTNNTDENTSTSAPTENKAEQEIEVRY